MSYIDGNKSGDPVTTGIHGSVECLSLDKIVKYAEEVERDKKLPSRRQLADVLHQRADQLHRNGDYESALVLYSRAARLHPTNTHHTVAAKRTTSLIISSTAKKSTRLRNQKTQKPPTPANIELKDVRVAESEVKNLPRHFDTGDLGRIRRHGKMELIRSHVMLSQLNDNADILGSMRKSFKLGNFGETIKDGNRLLDTVDLEDHRCRAAIHRYLALSHLALERHDRALDDAVKMILAAKRSKDISLRIRSFVVLGKVHLTFGHLTAAAVGWQALVWSIRDAVPKAWLLHEIGRCHYEMGDHQRALELSRRCCDWAHAGQSTKWICHGKLLGGQSLICLGRSAEAVETLRAASDAAHAGRLPIAPYVRDLLERTADSMRRRFEAGVKIDPVDEYECKTLTSRTRIIESDGNSGIDSEEPRGSCIIDKWKSYLKSQNAKC